MSSIFDTEDYAVWLADKICNGGDYEKEAATLLVKKAARIAELERQLAEAEKINSSMDDANALLAIDCAKLRGQLAERGEAVGKVVDSDMLGSPIMLWFKTPTIGTVVYTSPQVPEWQPIESLPDWFSGVLVAYNPSHNKNPYQLMNGTSDMTGVTCFIPLPAAPQSGVNPHE